MHRLRMWLAAGATLAVFATSGLTFAQGTVGGPQGQTPGNVGAPAHTDTWKQHPGGWQPGSLPGNHGFHRGHQGPGALHLGPSNWNHGPREPFAPWRQPFARGPRPTCYVLSTVSGTVSAITGPSLTIAESNGQTITLPLAANVVVTEGGVAVPPSALAPGQAVNATVTCQGLAGAVNILG